MGISQAKVFSRWEPLTLKNTRLGHHRVPQGISLPCSQVSGQGHVDIMPGILLGISLWAACLSPRPQDTQLLGKKNPTISLFARVKQSCAQRWTFIKP